ncbi:class I SAM-dependent DNA methyltransferase [Novosphingobium sp. KN65.2]|uniref:HsdM family class I SAM-dependent methyltransferase n=1 Tax=Novosphingobium sp. KN65.2 TaxID=1478134 RepID=UPI0018D0B9A3|nr:N-6 DNA methylase [Novosphingobium sp. KN65.2]
MLDRQTEEPMAVIEAKARASELDLAVEEAQSYAAAFIKDGFHPLAIGLAGADDSDFELRVNKWNGSLWVPITYEGQPINWIPTRDDLVRVASPATTNELRPTVPPPEVLAERAEEINRLLRESNIKDEFRPAVVAAIMLALWQSQGNIRRDPEFILKDINYSCKEAFIKAGKPKLASSIKVPEANNKLASRARRIAAILERLNVTVLTAEHDYLGQLYETFFRYTGGNTIGQYFTPRHIARFMTDIVQAGKDDIVLDPACGTGGFLVACMDRMLREHNMSREHMVAVVASQLIGFESEPVTAALCVANMILRGDGSTGIYQADAFSSRDFKKGFADIALMNPPFPHKKTDTAAEDFVDLALNGLKRNGKLAVILPTSILVKKDKGAWRERILKNNTLVASIQLPDELFQPYASATTSIIFLEKGVPHSSSRKSVFVRLHHDGWVLRKGTRVQRASEPNQIPAATDSVVNKQPVAGFSGLASINGKDEWAVGAYIPSAPPEDDEVKSAVDVLLRRMASFYARYAVEVVQQRRAVSAHEIAVKPYKEMLTSQRKKNSSALPAKPGTVGGSFEIFYGMKELHSREGIADGDSLVISPTESYNGCYGWLDFPSLIQAPFVTVAQTGSIGESFVQLEDCAVNDDCLVLLPRSGVDEVDLVIAAASLHAEKWRFTYGRKLTPARIADFALPSSQSLREWVEDRLARTKQIIEASLSAYDDAIRPDRTGSDTVREKDAVVR